ncbi:MAG TPA: hypothetical protein VFD88_04610, partial [Clostridia bacterium]|nr:hypothetical protein [Clostridia bacterium]
MVDRVDARLRPGEVVLHRAGRNEHVVHEGDERVVDLHAEAGVDDRLVLLAQCLRDSHERRLRRAVVLVDELGKAARRSDHGQEARFDTLGLHRRREVGDVTGDRILPGVGDLLDRREVAPRLLEVLLGPEVVGVELWKALLVGCRDRQLAELLAHERPDLEARQTLVDVEVPGGLAELAVADDVDCFWRRTTSRTPRSSAACRSAGSTCSPLSSRRMIAITSSGRIRLPTWVVLMRLPSMDGMSLLLRRRGERP